MESLTVSGETLDLLNRVRQRADQFGISLESAVRQALAMYLEKRGALTPDLVGAVTTETGVPSAAQMAARLLNSSPRG
jgi:hypothetical protein